MFVKQVYIDVNMVKGDNLNSPNNIFRSFNSEMSSINSNEHSDWSSQLIDNTVESSKLIHLTNGHDGFYVNVPPYYTLSRNPPFFSDAREAILHRFVYAEYGVVTPSCYITEELNHGKNDDDCICACCLVHASKDVTCDSEPTLSVSVKVVVADEEGSPELSLASLSSGKPCLPANDLSEDSDITLANGSVDLFSSFEDSSRELSANAQSDSDNQCVSSSKVIEVTDAADAETDCSSQSVRILKPKRIKHGKKVCIGNSKFTSTDTKGLTSSSSLQYKGGLTESQAICISTSDSNCSTESEHILRRKKPNRKS